ncbi:hypothetical protein L211DRAFT_869145 [Terfezia boudieri ATCC MYA-4762]|uniref:Uncharacterized protein n=1 Tax=Terfezia boudieri ATCC MYA-4762 TaxID=1051890 RepID=A0A3N4LIC3_9PEZI|nr:hypothetical protein L211DRAFT_869145 [Terfezia boudieri ATCC MYA-4762]
MLRLLLLRQPGLRVTTRSIAQQRIQYRGFFSEPIGEPKASPPRPGDINRLWDRILVVWDRVNKLDDRVHNLRKDLGDFKGDVYKSISEMERGFGEIRAKRHEHRAVNTDDHSEFGELGFETKIQDVKSDLKRTKWQVRLLFGVIILCLAKDLGLYRLNVVPEEIPDQNRSSRKWL